MPLSTSSSSTATQTARARSRPVKAATIWLLVLIALELASVEFLTGVGLQRISTIHRRILRDRAAARSIEPHGAGSGPVTVLLVGNSLLLEALDYHVLIKRLSPEIRPVRYTVEQTDYFDWYYALRDLFRRGSRPDAAVLCLDVADLLRSSSEIPGFVANFMIGAPDLLAYARDTNLDNTETSSEVFSHYSWFFAARSRMRTFFLYSVCPECVHLIHHAIWGKPQFPPDDVVMKTVGERVRALDKVCKQAHVRLILLTPPSLDRMLNLVAAAAARWEGVEVMTPVRPGVFGENLFRDGYHVNARGASLFTEALASEMQVVFPLRRVPSGSTVRVMTRH